MSVLLLMSTVAIQAACGVARLSTAHHLRHTITGTGGPMPDEASSAPPTRYCRALALAVRWLWVLAVMRFAVQGGPRSAPGYNHRRKFVPCPKCGKKVRLQADGWAYCRSCRSEFKFKGK